MSDNFTPLSKEEAYELINRTRNGDQAAKAALIEANAGLVKKIASKFSGFNQEMDDLVQIGYIGLIKAIDKFDMKFDVMFSTYAVPMIMGEIKRFIRDDGPIKAGRSVKSQVYALRRAKEEFLRKNGVSPHLSQLAEMLGIVESEVLDVIDAERAIGGIASLDDMLFETEFSGKLTQGSLTLGSPEEELDGLNLKESIETLPDKEKQVIYLRYYKDMTQGEIGRIIGVSQVQVSRLEKKALQDLKVIL